MGHLRRRTQACRQSRCHCHSDQAQSRSCLELLPAELAASASRQHYACGDVQCSTLSMQAHGRALPFYQSLALCVGVHPQMKGEGRRDAKDRQQVMHLVSSCRRKPGAAFRHFDTLLSRVDLLSKVKICSSMYLSNTFFGQTARD